MKKILYSIIVAGLALASAACQKLDEKAIDPATSPGGTLKVTASIVNFDGTKVSYAFSDNTDPKSGIKPSWGEGDEIFGFDDKGGTFTFTVSSISDGKAEFNTTDYNPAAGVTKLYAVYYPDKSVSDFEDEALDVDLSSQSGSLDKNAPVIMCATGTIEGNAVHFNFTNQTAIVGIYKMQVYKDGTPLAEMAVTDVTLKGATVCGTIQVKDGVLTLEAGTNDEDKKDLTATISSLETDSDGIVNVNVDSETGAIAPYFSVIPASNASLSIEATCDGSTCHTNASITGAINAGQYYYLGKKIYGGTVALINGTGYATISEAFATATDGQTIQLQNDCDFDSQITLADKTGVITLDLNGNTLYVGGKVGGNYRQIYLDEEDVTLKIKSSQDGGTITAKEENCDMDIIKVVKGNLVVESGTIAAYSNTTKGGNAAIRVEGAVGDNASASVTINGGSIKGADSKAEEGDPAYALYVNNENATVSITNGTFSSQSNNVRIVKAKDVDNDAGVSITGGTFTCETATQPTLLLDGQYSCNIGGSNLVVESKSNPVSVKGNVDLTITDGKFKSSVNHIAKAGDATVSIQGGRFSYLSGCLASSSLGENKGIQISADNTYKYQVVDKPQDGFEAEYEKSSNTFNFVAVTDALQAASGTSIVRLLNDCTNTKAKNLGNDEKLTLYLNGHTLTFNSNNRISPNHENAEWIIDTENTDGSEGEITSDDYTKNILYYSKGKVTLKKGTISRKTAAEGEASSNATASISGGTFNMEGGSLNDGGNPARALSVSGNTTVNISGGTISGTSQDASSTVYYNGTGIMTINGQTTITSKANGSAASAISVNNGTVKIQSGNIKGNGDLGALSLTGGSAEITGGTLLNEATNNVSKVVCTVAGATVDMSGGTIGTLSTTGSGLLRAVRIKKDGFFKLRETGEILSRRCSFYLLSNGKVEMTGGTINTGASGNNYYAFTIDANATGLVSIMSGNVKIDGTNSKLFGKLSDDTYTSEIPSNVTVTLTGGKYTKQPSQYTGIIPDTHKEVTLTGESPYGWQIVEK